MRPIKETDRVRYTKILTASGCTVTSITTIQVLRGSGVMVVGSFVRDGQCLTSIRVKDDGGAVIVGDAGYTMQTDEHGSIKLTPVEA